MKVSFLILASALASLAQAQSTTTTSGAGSSTAAPTPSYTLSVLNVTETLVRPIVSRSRTLTSSTTIITTALSTESIVLTPSSTSTFPTNTTSATPSATSTAPPSIHLDTKVDGAFAVLGVLLVLTGLPTAFLGHKNRWSSFFLLGFYSFTAVCAVVILKFGVLDRRNQQLSLPDAKLRGLYLFACAVAGFVGGAVSIFFWQMTKYLIGALGGLAVALWIQCLHHSGLVGPIGYRWLFYIGTAVIGFTLCTIPRIHYHVLLAATAMVGATAFMLGVDCFTTAGLKEFYIWNLGFTKMFPKFATIGFQVSQTMAIELGLIIAIAIAGAAVQLRVLSMLRVRLNELTEEHRRRDAALEAQASERYRDVEASRLEWEKQHASSDAVRDAPLPTPLLYMGESPETPSETPGTPASTTMLGGRPVSSLFSFPGLGGRMNSPPTPPATDRPAQSPGALPALDLGNTVKDELPATMIDTPTMLDDHPEIREKQHLVDEIREIRKSIDALSTQSKSTDAARSMMGSVMLGSGAASTKRTNSLGGELEMQRAVAENAAARLAVPSAAATATARPGSSAIAAARDRVRSMISMPVSGLTTSRDTPGASSSAARPTSVPLGNDDWDTYVRERKLFQPPSGVTPPIATSEVTDSLRPAPSEALLNAMAQRQRRESLFDPTLDPVVDLEGGGLETSSPTGRESRHSWFSFREDRPRPTRSATPPALAKRRRSDFSSSGPVSNLQRPSSPPAHQPIIVLPPARARSPPAQQPQSPRSPPRSRTPPAERVLTYEEYSERHKARLREMQAPLTTQEQKDATVADARERWEHSKVIEARYMTKKQAEEAERARRKQEQGSSPTSPTKSKTKRRTSVDVEASGGEGSSARRPEHRRNSLSLDRLAQSGFRMSSAFKVEEWQKYQAATTGAGDESSKSTGGTNVRSPRSRRE